jgi:hypothetical protein
MSVYDYASKEERKLLKQFEKGEMPKKLTDKQREDLLDSFGEYTVKNVPVKPWFDGKRTIDDAQKSVNDAFKKVKQVIKDNDIIVSRGDFNYDHIHVEGLVKQSDASLIKAFYNDWKKDQTSLDTQIKDLTKQLTALKVRQVKTTPKKTKETK